jgi:hypothetical protein
MKISDSVFALAEINGEERDGDIILNKDSRLIGTGFFFGKRGYFCTASHIFDGVDIKKVWGFFTNKSNKFYLNNIENLEINPKYDIAIAKLKDFEFHSFEPWLNFSYTKPNSALNYDMWSYPNLIAEKRAEFLMPNSSISFLPELIFQTGYVRRRFSQEIPYNYFKGDKFIELSEIGGSCASGAPIIESHTKSTKWQVCGVYLGEETATLKVGYGVPVDAFGDWSPACLGRSLRDESRL